MVKGSLPPLWEAQVASLKIPGTGMVVTTDLVDDIKDIHPKDKVDVGDRLARWALAKTYGKNVVYTGPLYKSMRVEGNKVRLSFAHADGGLKSRDGKPLSEFEIAGEDGKFVPAKAAIDGDAVVVQADEVACAAQVRFGWRNVANPNLANKEGLPASPFQTKDWKVGRQRVIHRVGQARFKRATAHHDSFKAIGFSMSNDPQAPKLEASPRLMSLDALRGFDMFWISARRDWSRACGT